MKAARKKNKQTHTNNKKTISGKLQTVNSLDHINRICIQYSPFRIDLMWCRCTDSIVCYTLCIERIKHFVRDRYRHVECVRACIVLLLLSAFSFSVFTFCIWSVECGEGEPVKGYWYSTINLYWSHPWIFPYTHAHKWDFSCLFIWTAWYHYPFWAFASLSSAIIHTHTHKYMVCKIQCTHKFISHNFNSIRFS